MQIRYALGLIVLLFGLVGCASHPLGIDKDTWERMSPEQQHAAYQKQAQLRAERQERQRQHEALMAQQKQQAFEQAGFGDKLQCVVRQGHVQMSKETHPITPVGFRVVRGFSEQIDVEYQRQNHTRTYSQALNVEFDGMQARFCEGTQQRHCAVMAGTTREFARGMTTRLEAPRIHARIYCELEQDGTRHHYRR